MCTRNSGYPTATNEIVCRFCPKCSQVFPSTSSYNYVLTVGATSGGGGGGGGGKGKKKRLLAKGGGGGGKPTP